MYPVLYVLVPAYIVLGLVLGQAALAYVSLLIMLASKMSYTISEDDDDIRIARKTVFIRRFARAVQARQTFQYLSA